MKIYRRHRRMRSGSASQKELPTCFFVFVSYSSVTSVWLDLSARNNVETAVNHHARLYSPPQPFVWRRAVWWVAIDSSTTHAHLKVDTTATALVAVSATSCTTDGSTTVGTSARLLGVSQ